MFWHDGIGLFPAGMSFANDAGNQVLRGPRDYAAVRQALTHAGYNGEKIVVLAPTDVQPIRALSLVGTDQLRRATDRDSTLSDLAPGRLVAMIEFV